MKETQLPKPFDDRFIAEQLEQMVSKNYPIREIVHWFARWGYEEGEASALRRARSPILVPDAAFGTWLPIDSAPKSGRFLVLGGKCKSESHGTLDDDGPIVYHVRRDSDGDFVVCNCDYYHPTIIGPTHWTPEPGLPPELQGSRMRGSVDE